MADMMTFPDTVEEFMEQYKITDTEQIYANGAELVPIFRMKQWFDHKPEQKNGRWVAVGECYIKCSECGLETTKNELRGIALFGENEPYFCPNCGADMRGGDSDEQT